MYFHIIRALFKSTRERFSAWCDFQAFSCRFFDLWLPFFADVNLVAEPKPHQIGRKRSNVAKAGGDWWVPATFLLQTVFSLFFVKNIWFYFFCLNIYIYFIYYSNFSVSDTSSEKDFFSQNKTHKLRLFCCFLVLFFWTLNISTLLMHFFLCILKFVLQNLRVFCFCFCF